MTNFCLKNYVPSIVRMASIYQAVLSIPRTRKPSPAPKAFTGVNHKFDLSVANNTQADGTGHLERKERRSGKKKKKKKKKKKQRNFLTVMKFF
jgi:hypothetical protein